MCCSATGVVCASDRHAIATFVSQVAGHMPRAPLAEKEGSTAPSLHSVQQLRAAGVTCQLTSIAQSATIFMIAGAGLFTSMQR